MLYCESLLSLSFSVALQFLCFYDPIEDHRRIGYPSLGGGVLVYCRLLIEYSVEYIISNVEHLRKHYKENSNLCFDFCDITVHVQSRIYTRSI